MAARWSRYLDTPNRRGVVKATAWTEAAQCEKVDSPK
jgi:hypothetical protein